MAFLHVFSKGTELELEKWTGGIFGLISQDTYYLYRIFIIGWTKTIIYILPNFQVNSKHLFLIHQNARPGHEIFNPFCAGSIKTASTARIMGERILHFIFLFSTGILCAPHHLLCFNQRLSGMAHQMGHYTSPSFTLWLRK